MNRLAIVLLAAVASNASALDGANMIARVNRGMKRLASIYKDETLPTAYNMLQEGMGIKGFEQRMEEFATARRLSSCGFFSALMGSPPTGCTGTHPYAGSMLASEFTSYCTTGCAAGLKTLGDTWIKNSACSSDKGSIRVASLTCQQAGGVFCQTPTAYANFYTQFSQLMSWNASVDATSMCAANSCFKIHLAQFLNSTQDAQLTKIAKVVMKHLCAKPPGSSTTCWPTFTGLFSGGQNPFQMMTTNPAGFCANECLKMGLKDLFSIASPAQLPMVEKIFSFACIINERGHYCYASMEDMSPRTNVMNYNNDMMTRPRCLRCQMSDSDPPVKTPSVCSDPPSQQETDTPDCSPGTGQCAPWCRTTSGDYDCNANIGKCDDYTACNNLTWTGDPFTQQNCMCKQKAGQLLSLSGCCLGGLIDLNAVMYQTDPSEAGNVYVDYSTFERDAAASASKGFPMSKAMARVEACGFRMDPRCTKGETANTSTFTFTADGFPTSVCQNATFKAEIESYIASAIADELGGSSADYIVTLGGCVSGGRRLSTTTSSVQATGTPATNLDMVEQTLSTSSGSGTLQDSVSSSLASSGVTGVTLLDVGTPTRGTTSGVQGTSGTSVGAVASGAQCDVGTCANTGRISGARKGAEVTFMSCLMALILGMFSLQS